MVIIKAKEINKIFHFCFNCMMEESVLKYTLNINISKQKD